MARTVIEDVSEELNNIFMKCDENGSGVVEINSLISFLTSQDPIWHGDEKIEEEFRKVLCVNESNQFITKDDFISVLLEWFQASFSEENETQQEGESYSAEVSGKCSSSSSGIGESTESSTSCSLNSLEEDFTTVHFVSDGQNMTTENTVGEIPFMSIESPCTKKKSTIAMKNEMNSLQRKNEYLESANNALVVQMSSLEDIIVKYEKESKANHRKLLDINLILEGHKQKQEETEERLNVIVEENKSVTIELSRSERENCKLKEYMTQLKEQSDKILIEKNHLYNKLQELKNRFKTLSDFHSKAQDELRALKINEGAKKEALEKVVQKNRNLQSQLKSSDILVQELKCELTGIITEFTNLKKAQMENKLESNNGSGDISSENSMVFSDEKFILDSSIPFEKSLLAELRGKVIPAQTDCCFCMKNILFPSTSDECIGTEYCSTLDAAVGTEEKKFTDAATITEFCDSQEYRTSARVAVTKDVGVDCSIKDSIADKNITDMRIRPEFCDLKPKRFSIKRRILRPILLLLGFLLGISSSLFTVIYIYIVCPEPCLLFSFVLELLHITIKYSDLPY